MPKDNKMDKMSDAMRRKGMTKNKMMKMSKKKMAQHMKSGRKK